MDFAVLNNEMIAAKPYFKKVSPSMWSLLGGQWGYYARFAKTGVNAAKHVKAWSQGKPVSEAVGEFIGDQAVRAIVKPVKRQVVKAHKTVNKQNYDLFRKNGMGGRTWLTKPGHYPIVMVFHDANRAGPHIDIHIGRMSVIYRVKPDTYSQLKYNREGYLTENSRKLLMDHVRSEIMNGSRLPQNLDHSLSNAKATWVGGSREGKNYGDGVTRQVFYTGTVDIYKAHEGGPIEMYAPGLVNDRSLYMYPLYPATRTTAPILIWGAKSAAPPVLDDRLHLKLVDPKDVDKLAGKADLATSTGKYDGSSCYVVITNKGTTVWSPRQSVVTGSQIEYTPKINGIAQIHSDQTVVAMGELLFREKSWNPFIKPSYMASAAGSGILNSHSVLPKNVVPEIRLYRVDRIGRTKTKDLPFEENRKLQEQVSSLHPHLKVVEKMGIDEARERGFEGIVVAPQDKSVNEAFKVKFWQDAHDWEVTSVELGYGPSGTASGVVWFKSLESGKSFKLGPGGIGNREITDDMTANPHHYIGRVAKVQSREGHEARAAKMVAWHDDKGMVFV